MLQGLSPWNWDNMPYERTKHWWNFAKAGIFSGSIRDIRRRTMFLQWNAFTIWWIMYKHICRSFWGTTKKNYEFRNCFYSESESTTNTACFHLSQHVRLPSMYTYLSPHCMVTAPLPMARYLRQTLTLQWSKYTIVHYSPYFGDISS